MHHHEPIQIFLLASTNEKIKNKFDLLDPGAKVWVFVAEGHGHIFQIRLIHHDLTFGNFLEHLSVQYCFSTFQGGRLVQFLSSVAFLSSSFLVVDDDEFV